MAVKTTVPKPKQAALRTIREMKDTVSYEDMMYELYVLQKIDRGRKEARRGHTVTHGEAKERLSKWLK